MLYGYMWHQIDALYVYYYNFIKEVKGLNNKCVYNTVYNIEVTCRSQPLVVDPLNQCTASNRRRTRGQIWHFTRFYSPTHRSPCRSYSPAHRSPHQSRSPAHRSPRRSRSRRGERVRDRRGDRCAGERDWCGDRCAGEYERHGDRCVGE